MKKILYTSLFAACAAMSLSSCMNGDYDANPATANTGSNPLNTGGSGGSGGGSSFNWSGTDPLSAKIEGASYTGTSASFISNGSGPIQYDAVSSTLNGGVIVVGFPKDAAPGTYTSNATGTGINYSVVEDGVNNGYVSNAFGGSGQIQITENDASHVKGKFFGTLKSSAGKSKAFTEGYFNVTK